MARENAQRHALKDVLARFFGGKAEDLVLRLIEDEGLAADQLDEIRRAVAATAAGPRPGRESPEGRD